jgi:hypothetical protein
MTNFHRPDAGPTDMKISALFYAAILVFSAHASAAVIDNRGPINGGIGAFGSAIADPTVSTTYGQTIAIGADHILTDFSLYLYGNNVSMNLRGYVAGWDGSKATEILYTSELRTVTANRDMQEFAFSTGRLSLATGRRYVLFLSVADLGPQPDASFTLPSTGMSYAGGESVYYYRDRLGDGLDFSLLTARAWNTDAAARLPDIAFTAHLVSEVPEPVTLGLMCAGLAALGARRRTA